MALPDSRNTTYAPLTQVASADLNALQDSVVNRSHGEIRALIQPHAMNGFNVATPGYVNSPYEAWSLAGGSAEYVLCPLTLPVAQDAEITQIDFYGTAGVSGATTGMSARLVESFFDANQNVPGQTKFGPTASGDFVVTFDTSDALLPFALTGTRYPYLELGPGDGGARIWDVRGVIVTFRQPIP